MTDFEQRYVSARKAVIARDLARLNPMQRQGAMTTEGPLLLLAGAGSGKTTVLIQRVYNLLTYGRGSDSDEVPDWATEEDLDFLEHFPDRPDADEVRRVHRLCAVDVPRPWEIIAITFTNKAAGELKDRLAARLGPFANDIWASTFHSACVRILRRDIDRLGFDKDFTIYDTDDSKRVIKDILKEQNLDEKTFPIRSVLSAISASKDRYEGPEVFRKRAEASNDWKSTRIAKIYAAYQQKLSTANALDFDDIIYHTVTLLQKEPEVLDYYQKKFRYVLVDEYQDTNHLQYLLTQLLAGGYRNLCVVGDDDQSIYRFRGANIENILNFEKQYKDARVIRLEQNYRSTSNILSAANALIENNNGRLGKKLWTDGADGEPISLYCAFNDLDEARFVVNRIKTWQENGGALEQCAILYRSNAQSRVLEEALLQASMPYRIYGGMRFFERQEIKDALSYLRLIANRNDDAAFERVVNTPTRGIGDRTLDVVRQTSRDRQLTLWQASRELLKEKALAGRAASALQRFMELIDALAQETTDMPLHVQTDRVIKDSGLRAMYEQEKGEKGQTRIENLEELVTATRQFSYNEEDEDLMPLQAFLSHAALEAGEGQADTWQDAVQLMTLHSAKGLEFPQVFIVGVEEGMFPSQMALDEGGRLEEERRLAYVGVTRAMQKLTLTYAETRRLYGKEVYHRPSRFIGELPQECVEEVRLRATVSRPVNHQRLGAPIAESDTGYKLGQRVRHPKFGEGTIVNLEGSGEHSRLQVAFQGQGIKWLVAAYARLEAV